LNNSQQEWNPSRHIEGSGFEKTEYSERKDSRSDHGTGYTQGDEGQENQ